VDGTPFGRYRLVSLLGRGGMGEVWKAYDTSMNRVVALKVLPPNFADDEQFQVRFRREAHMAAGLDEPHVVPIHDSGEIDGRLYVTMRLIDGKTVNELLEGGPLAPQRAVWIVEQIAAALNAAHKVGLVHRDVKPSNILVTDDDFAYLIDFGIARVAGATKLTGTGAAIGTVAYMAPERFSTDTIDARADTYALACVLSECLTGVQPFPGESVERQLAGHLTLPPPRPSTMQPGVPPALDDVIAKGMAKNPDDRYATTKDFAAAARAALGGASITDHRGAARPSNPAALASQPAPPSLPGPPSMPGSPSQPAAPVYPSLSASAPSWPAAASAPVPYPDTGQNPLSAGAPPTAQQPMGGPPPPPPMGGGPTPWPAAPGSQLSQGNQQRWLVPALLGGAALLLIVVIAAVVLVINWQSDSPSSVASSNRRPTDTPSASIPSFTLPSNFPSFSIPAMPGMTPGQTQGTEQLLTADGLTGLLTSIREKFGDTMGFRMVVYPEYASLNRPDPADSRRNQGYDYRNGAWTTGIIATSISPLDNLGDLGKFDVAAVTAQIPGVAQKFDFKNPDASYLIVEGEEGGNLRIAIYASDHGLSGRVEVNPDGSVSKVYPP
jgi:serine/threonine-protein kinase